MASVRDCNPTLRSPRVCTAPCVIAQHQRLQDNNAADVTPQDMLGELCADNQQLTRFLRATHAVCDEYHDVATASLIEIWIDETERRTWFLAEITGNL